MDFFDALYSPNSISLPTASEDDPDNTDNKGQKKEVQSQIFTAEKYYTILFFSTHISFGIKMLEGNYQGYTQMLELNSLESDLKKKKLGERIDYLNWVEWTMEVYPQYEPFKSNKSYLNHSNIPIVKRRVNEWIETKKKELETPQENQVTIKPFDKVKSYITHPQQVLLFHELGIIKFLTDKFNLGQGQIEEIISLLANRGKDNTGDYIRSLDLPKERTAKSKQNLYAQTPENIEFARQVIKKITPPE